MTNYFKEYDEIIKKHKFDITFIYIYYNLQLNDEFKNLNDEQKKYSKGASYGWILFRE